VFPGCFLQKKRDIVRRVVIFFIVFLIVACKSTNKNEYIIPEEDFKQILVEIHLKDGMAGNSRLRRDASRYDTTNIYTTSIEKYGYTREQFDSTLNYYAFYINALDRVYDDVIRRLNEKETEIRQAIKEQEEAEEEVENR